MPWLGTKLRQHNRDASDPPVSLRYKPLRAPKSLPTLTSSKLVKKRVSSCKGVQPSCHHNNFADMIPNAVVGYDAAPT